MLFIWNRTQNAYAQKQTWQISGEEIRPNKWTSEWMNWMGHKRLNPGCRCLFVFFSVLFWSHHKLRYAIAPAEILCKCFAARYFSIDKWIINRNDFSLFSVSSPVQLCNCFPRECIFRMENLFIAHSRDSMANEIYEFYRIQLKPFAKCWEVHMGSDKRNEKMHQLAAQNLITLRNRMIWKGPFFRSITIELVAAIMFRQCLVHYVIAVRLHLNEILNTAYYFPCWAISVEK